MKICIPSSGRYNTATTPSILSTAILYVPENEVLRYKSKFSNDIVGCPKRVCGITKTRNYILSQNKNKDILFVDDDVRECGVFVNGVRKDMANSESGDIFTEEFERLFDVCKGLGFKIWGCENGGSSNSNHPLIPFSFKGSITGNLLGIVNDGEMMFDERFEVKEDYDLVLHHFKKKGGHLKARNFYWRNTNWTGPGGCVEYRTDKMEIDAISLLKKRYGGMIISGERKNKHSITVRWA